MKRLLGRWWPWVLAVGSVVAAALVVGPGSVAGTPLDPRSTAPDGARAVVDILDELDRDVSVATRPPPAGGAVVVLRDALDADARDELERWLRSGGRLVVADPMSPLLGDIDLVGRLASDVVGPTDLPPACDDAELADVRTVRSASWGVLSPGPDDQVCFELEGGAWLVRRDVGAGELIALGGADAFTNRRVGAVDNALLLTRLVGPDGPVVVADASPPGGGEATLGELVPDRVYAALAVLVLAFLVGAWARGRRLGDPVEEQLPVRVPASELVLATADLMHRAEVRTAAADALRDELRRDATSRLGLPEDAPDDVLTERIATWTGTDPEGVVRTLATGPVQDDESLVRTARSVSRLRRRLTGGPLASLRAGEGDDR